MSEAEARELRAMLKAVFALPEGDVLERNRALQSAILAKLQSPELGPILVRAGKLFAESAAERMKNGKPLPPFPGPGCAVLEQGGRTLPRFKRVDGERA